MTEPLNRRFTKNNSDWSIILTRFETVENTHHNFFVDFLSISFVFFSSINVSKLTTGAEKMNVSFYLVVIGCLAVHTSADSELINKLGGNPAPPASSKPLQTHLADHPACQKDLEALAHRCQLSQVTISSTFITIPQVGLLNI